MRLESWPRVSRSSQPGSRALSLVSPDTSYFTLAAIFAVLGAGMSVTAAPATGEIMSAVPLSKAGIGSAVNDTTRELGGALGIAILGSIANSAYRSGIDLSSLGLAAGPRAEAEDSIGAAVAVSGNVDAGGEVKHHAAAAFTDAFNVASAVSVGLALAAAVGAPVVVTRPARRRCARDDPRLRLGTSTRDSDVELIPVGAGAGPE